MSNFTPLVIQEYEFEGDTISITFSRLKRKHMLDAMPALKHLSDVADTEDLTEKTDAINAVLNSIVDFIPEYVESFTGLNDTTGNPVSIETVCSEFYFMELAAQIANGMLESSSGKEGKA